MKKIRCIAVDDEPLALNLIEKYILQTPFLELIEKCKNGLEALSTIHEKNIELIFLDIQMPDFNGLELSKAIENDIKIIFTTAFENYAIEGFKVSAIDYLLKPFSYEEFLKSATKAKKWFDLVEQSVKNKYEKNFIFIKSEYKQLKINLDDLLYIEGLKDYVKIYIRNQEKPILSLTSLKALEEELPSNQFMRIHRSFIINLEKIDSIERGQVVINQTRITIAAPFKEKLDSFLFNK